MNKTYGIAMVLTTGAVLLGSCTNAEVVSEASSSSLPVTNQTVTVTCFSKETVGLITPPPPIPGAAVPPHLRMPGHLPS